MIRDSRKKTAAIVTAGAVLASIVVSCSKHATSLPPYGEVLVEIDTDLGVPRSLSRVRIDLFDHHGTWLDSRDFATPNASDFPLSFSVYSESETDARDVFVRVRGYPEGRDRDYLGERFEPRPSFTEPTTPSSLGDACANALELPLGVPVTARLRGEPFADAANVACDGSATGSGLVAFRFDAPRDGTYRIAVEQAEPNGPWSYVGDTILSLRSTCADSKTEVACNDNIDAYNVLSAVGTTLKAGSYSVVLGNVAQGPMDVTLYASSEVAAADAGVPSAASTGSAEPRLISSGVDITPAKEPLPNLAVDRFAWVHIVPKTQSTARLVLHGDCVGTMADIASKRTCLDTEGTLVPVAEESVVAGRIHDATSATGTWAGYRSVPCTGTPKAATTANGVALFDDQACVAGGSFVLGDPDIIGSGADSGQPERVAIVSPFYMDRHEYTVGRYRDLLRRGFTPPDSGALNNFGPVTLDPTDLTLACTWNAKLDGSPFAPAQESFPLSCVSWTTARAACRFDGGDLPTAAQREYEASASGRTDETSYPWGNVEPTCDQALYGRWTDLATGDTECENSPPGNGPRAVDAAPWATADITPDGIVGLGGSLSEWTLDSHRAYSDPCWQSQPLEDPRCMELEAPLRTISGTSFRDSPGRARSATRLPGAPAATDPSIGFRCVYPMAGGK